MMQIKKYMKQQGFTLIEMLLVLVIVSTLIWAGVGYLQQRTLQTRMDRTAVQMQQILNAGLAYYIANGSWPASLACLQGQAGCTAIYLPSPLTSSWANNYVVSSNSTLLFVHTIIPASTASGTATATANAIAGVLPLSYTTSNTVGTPPASGAPCAPTALSCTVVASVNIPGQALNTARSINFAGLYHHGGCIPVPKCPVDANGTTMTPQVMIAPVSVSGVNDASNPSETYSINSFTAYASGPPAANPDACKNGTQVPCTSVSGGAATSYWRACLQVVTEKGDVAITNTGTGNNAWGKNVTLLGMTRCAVTGEPEGSTGIFSK
jgi:prepilin-type N-terminal cleavage/methylation domain-containing protein